MLVATCDGKVRCELQFARIGTKAIQVEYDVEFQKLQRYTYCLADSVLDSVVVGDVLRT